MKRPYYLYIITAMSWLTAQPSEGQEASRLSPRSRIVLSESNRLTAGAAGGQTDKDGMQRTSAGTRMLTAYLTTTADADWEALRELGVDVTLMLDGTATARIPEARLAEVAAVRGVIYVQAAAPVSQMLDVARPEAGADKAAAGTGLAQTYTGRGVVVGIVDAGFDYTHAAFRDADGRLRISRVWEQSSTATGNYHAPEKYGYGIELASAADIENAGGDIRNNSHGTHVTGIAAGSDSYMDGAWTGVAPEADIVLVSMGETSRDNVNLTNAISYIFDYADAEGKPCVVNLSLGNHAGPHDGTSTFDVIADRLQGPGRLIVGSAGNHRSDRFHVMRTFGSAGDEPLRTFVDFKTSVSASSAGGDIEIWGSEGAEFEVTLSAYSLSNKNDVETVVVYPSGEAVQSVSLGRNLVGTVTVASEVSPLNGKPHVMLTSALTAIRSKYALVITVTPKSSGQVDVWADNLKVGLTSNDIEGFSGPAGESTICEIGGTAQRILSVGAYTTRNEYTILGETTARTLNEQPDAISSFSSCGPTADGRLKPEVTAPGCYIISAVSQNDASGTLVLAQSHNDGMRDYQYGYMQGTSMAAPFVTGTVALWLQACPTLTPEQLKDVVKATARQDARTGVIGEAGDNSWGYGKIDVYEGLRECIELVAAGIETANAPFDGMLTMEGGCIRLVRASSNGSVVASVYAADGSLRSTVTVSGTDSRIDVSTLPAGVYILKIAAGGTTRAVKFSR